MSRERPCPIDKLAPVAHTIPAREARVHHAGAGDLEGDLARDELAGALLTGQLAVLDLDRLADHQLDLASRAARAGGKAGAGSFQWYLQRAVGVVVAGD